MNKSDKFKSMPVDHYLRMFKADKTEKSINVSDHFQKPMQKHHQIYFQKIKLQQWTRVKNKFIDKLISVKQKINGQDEYINFNLHN